MMGAKRLSLTIDPIVGISMTSLRVMSYTTNYEINCLRLLPIIGSAGSKNGKKAIIFDPPYLCRVLSVAQHSNVLQQLVLSVCT